MNKKKKIFYWTIYYEPINDIKIKLIQVRGSDTNKMCFEFMELGNHI